VLYYRRDLWQAAYGGTRFLAGSARGRTGWPGTSCCSLVGTLPAVICALSSVIGVEAAFKDPRLVAGCLVVTGSCSFPPCSSVADSAGRDRSMRSSSGLFQRVAFSGDLAQRLDHVGGLFRRLKPEEAARFSFLLSIPAIVGAVVFKAKEVRAAGGSESSCISWASWFFRPWLGVRSPCSARHAPGRFGFRVSTAS